MIFEDKAGDIARLQALFKQRFVYTGRWFTFERLANVPRVSIKGRPFMDGTATGTICGEPWEIFKKNELVYDFTRNQVVPISSITARTEIGLGYAYYTCGGLILPGSTVDGGGRVKDYSAWFSLGKFNFRYSEVGID